ncbi:MAG: aminoacyl-tRNA hydrolase [Patescibacteria group bacterium]|nr:aminoacyl-tRNA hydrolase [Patescibacteria group bacterium]MBU2508965.1 aminoacyl-tRNA hydrolase [Patescibacteria group bacterium]
MKLIIGLGNPGETYEHTRHNVGGAVVDLLIERLDLKLKKDTKRHAEFIKTEADGVSVVIAKPTTFMNASGSAVQALASYYKVEPKDILVIQDEMDLLPGKLSFLTKRGAAGHNGISDIQEKLGSKEFDRLRIGIGRPGTRIKTEDWVLNKPNKKEEALINSTLEKAGDAVLDWAIDGVNKAMNKWNTSPSY